MQFRNFYFFIFRIQNELVWIVR